MAGKPLRGDVKLQRRLDAAWSRIEASRTHLRRLTIAHDLLRSVLACPQVNEQHRNAAAERAVRALMGEATDLIEQTKGTRL